MADGELAVTARHRYAVCMMQGDLLRDPIARLYGLASWWLTYDPQWSVIAPVSPGSDGFAIFSDEDVVPAEPLRTAHEIGDLRADGNLYVREFRSCYETGKPIGRCAAVVNPSPVNVAMPHFAQTYTMTLELGSKSSFGGGSNTWVHRVPLTLAPRHAEILRG